MEKNKKPSLREVLSDVLMVAGGVLLCVGIGMVCFEAGVCAAGVVFIVYGGLIAGGGNE